MMAMSDALDRMRSELLQFFEEKLGKTKSR
jgi:hypothetical protein